MVIQLDLEGLEPLFDDEQFSMSTPGRGKLEGYTKNGIQICRSSGTTNGLLPAHAHQLERPAHPQSNQSAAAAAAGQAEYAESGKSSNQRDF